MRCAELADVHRDERLLAGRLGLAEARDGGRVERGGVQVEPLVARLGGREPQFGEEAAAAVMQGTGALHRVAVPDVLGPGAFVQVLHVAGPFGGGLQRLRVDGGRLGVVGEHEFADEVPAPPRQGGAVLHPAALGRDLVFAVARLLHRDAQLAVGVLVGGDGLGEQHVTQHGAVVVPPGGGQGAVDDVEEHHAWHDGHSVHAVVAHDEVGVREQGLTFDRRHVFRHPFSLGRRSS
ncbi:hypothetical protein GCM10009677_16120 [Sphaerisporangium rubeum]